MNYIIDFFTTPVYADEKEEQAPVEEVEEETPAEEPEEEEEPEDVKPAIEEECGETAACLPLKHHLEECSKRVNEEGAHEDCIEELYHFLHCVNDCAVPKYWSKLV